MRVQGNYNTGTRFALVTSFMALGRTLLSAFSGWAMEWIGWFDFFVLSTVVALPGLLLLPWMMHNLPIAIQSGVNASAGRANGGDP